MIKKLLLLALCISFLYAEKNPVEFDYELDIYYSNVSAFLNLDRDKNITDGTHLTEKQIYTKLMRKTLSPNIFLIEASFHPMAWGGMWYRKNYPDKYTQATINDFNLIKALSAGWEEPYALSFFVGRMLVFKREDASHIGKNRAYIGWLLSIGNKSIKDNLDYRDHWFNVEYKLKGTRDLAQKDLDWSFRIGYRHHSNTDFVNTLYIGARRSSIDYKKPLMSLRYNSAFDIMLECDEVHFNLTKAQFIIDKKWPIKRYNIAFGLGIGYLYYSGSRYQGALKEEGVDRHQLILRPNLTW